MGDLISPGQMILSYIFPPNAKVNLRCPTYSEPARQVS